jgi:hypothetical protein
MTALEVAIKALRDCRSRGLPAGYDSGDSAIVEIVNEALAKIERIEELSK